MGMQKWVILEIEEEIYFHYSFTKFDKDDCLYIVFWEFDGYF
jgi:hypothetical protein